MAKISNLETIREFQGYFREIYPNNDLSEDYIYAYFSRTVSYLCKNLSSRHNSTDSFIETVAWLFSLANKFEIDIQEAVLRRYPGVCHYCISRPCQCHKTLKQPVSRIPLYKVVEELEARYRSTATIPSVTIDWFAKQIDEIYQNNDILWTNAGPWRHLMKMQEEVGEIHEAYTGYIRGRKSKMSLANEFADVSGWIFGAWSITHRGKSFSESLKNYYMGGCPVCSKDVCVCEPRAGRSKELLDEVKLKEIQLSFLNLAEQYPNDTEVFEDLEASFQTALKSEDEGVRRQTILKARNSLGKILDSSGKVSKNANSVFKTIETLASFFGA